MLYIFYELYEHQSVNPLNFTRGKQSSVFDIAQVEWLYNSIKATEEIFVRNGENTDLLKLGSCSQEPLLIGSLH